MKIFNKEDDKEVVYVALNDLGMLTRSDLPIPACIFTQVFSKPLIINDQNRWEFIRFTDPIAIAFFKNADWIVDYKFYRHMTEEELISHGQAISDEMNNIASKFNAYPENERKNHYDLKEKHDLLDHKFHSLPPILWLKQGYMTMPIPEVPDSDGFKLKSDTNNSFPYTIAQGLNPLQMLLYRNDGEILSKSEILPLGLLQSADSLLITNNLEKNEFFGDFEKTTKLSDNQKYFITTFRIITPEEKEAKEKTSKQKEEPLTLSKKIKQALSKLIKR